IDAFRAEAQAAAGERLALGRGERRALRRDILRRQAAQRFAELEEEAARGTAARRFLRAQKRRQAARDGITNETRKAAAHAFAQIAFEKITGQRLDARREHAVAGREPPDRAAAP